MDTRLGIEVRGVARLSPIYRAIAPIHGVVVYAVSAALGAYGDGFIIVGGFPLRDEGPEAGGGFFHIGYRHGKGFGEDKASLIGGLDADGIAVLRLEVEGGFGVELATIDLKRGVIIGTDSHHQGVGEGIARVHIGGGEGSDHGIRRVILGDGRCTQSDGGGRFIDIGNRHGEGFLKTIFSIPIGVLDADGIALLRLEVEGGFGVELATIDLKRGVIIGTDSHHQGVGEVYAEASRSRRCGEGSDHGTHRSILGDGRGSQGDVGYHGGVFVVSYHFAALSHRDEDKSET